MIHSADHAAEATAAGTACRKFLCTASRMSDVTDPNDPFARFASSWASRAAVKGREPHLDEVYAPEHPDFLVELLPFRAHPLFQSASERSKQRILSCGWLAYNAKTIAIESKVINPACLHVIDGDLPGIPGARYREATCQAMVDESYHILLTSNACDMTRVLRDLEHVRLPRFELVRQMQREQDRHPERWRKTLIQLATAVVSELLVSDYLKLLSDSPTVQPLNVLTTAIHRKDESAHNGLFKTLGSTIYAALSKREQHFFLQALCRPSGWFASPEWGVWRSMLGQIGFPGADRMIDECAADAMSCETHLNLSSLERLLIELDLDPAMLRYVNLDNIPE